MAAFRRQVQWTLAALAWLCALPSCRGGDTGQQTQPGAQTQQGSGGGPSGGLGNGGQAAQGAAGGALALPHGATRSASDKAFGDDPVSWLDLKYQLELPRSTQTQAITLPWQEVTPTAMPAVPNNPKGVAKAVVHRWIEPVLLLGRSEVATGEQVLGKLRCQAEQKDLCSDAGLRAPTGRQRLDFDPAQADANGLPGWLVKAAGDQGWRGKPVLLFADRRVAIQAVLQAQSALLAAGAEPRLVTATLYGTLGYVLPPQPQPPTLLAFEPTTAVADVDAAPDRVPRDLIGVVVEVYTTGMHLTLKRPAPHPATTPELLGDVVQALNIWAERARTTAPQLKVATVRAAAEAPWEEVVRAIDGLRDTCARAAKGTPCHDNRSLFAWVTLDVLPVAPPAAIKPATPM